MRTHYGGWIQTFTGKRFWPFDPDPDDIDIKDIAHALSNLCRFGGHTKFFYSVAEHSINVCRECHRVDGLWGLLHDASEAYLLDLPSPVKHHPDMQLYREAEARLMEMICQRFGLPIVCPDSVHLADAELLATEAQQLIGPQVQPWIDMPEPLSMLLSGLKPEIAERTFLTFFNVLYKGESHGKK
jgi:hypothetical protein